MFILRSTSVFCVLFTLVVNAPTGSAQTDQSATAEVRDQQTARQPSPQLLKLLTDWERGSAAIKTLEGRHQRRIYDDTFKVEKLAHGTFWYAGPDKGRIDISEVEITPKMLADRNDPKAKVERDETGTPYKLKSDEKRRWVCDGVKLFDIDDERKEARVTNLPPENRGANIMNTPLPFLFGMPPNDALKRYSIQIDDVNDRANPPYALLTIYPRWPGDARNYKKAQVYLNTENYLPIAVKLIDPAETKRTVYSFFDPKINRRWVNPLSAKFWVPNLRGYQVNVVEQGQQPVAQTQNQQRQKPSGQPSVTVVPNVVGVAHNRAVEILVKAGIPQANIRKLKAGPAPRANLTFLVSRQSPANGAPVNGQTKVDLFIYTEPAQAAGARPAAAVRQVSGARPANSRAAKPAQ